MEKSIGLDEYYKNFLAKQKVEKAKTFNSLKTLFLQHNNDYRSDKEIKQLANQLVDGKITIDEVMEVVCEEECNFVVA